MKYLVIFVFSMVIQTSFAQSPLTGIWDTGNENTQVEVIEEKGKVIGKILSSDYSKAVVGSLVLKDLKRSKDSWTGQIYSAKRGKWYDVQIVPHSRLLELEISVGIFSKSVEWRKIR